MKKYNTPESEIDWLTDASESSKPQPGENEGDIIPWNLDWLN